MDAFVGWGAHIAFVHNERDYVPQTRRERSVRQEHGCKCQYAFVYAREHVYGMRTYMPLPECSVSWRGCASRPLAPDWGFINLQTQNPNPRPFVEALNTYLSA